MKIDILELSEMSWPKARDVWSSEYRFLHTGTTENNTGIGEGGILLNKAPVKKVKKIMQYNERIILIKIETKPKDTIIG